MAACPGFQISANHIAPLISMALTFSACPSSSSTKQMLGMLSARDPRETIILQFRARRRTCVSTLWQHTLQSQFLLPFADFLSVAASAGANTVISKRFELTAISLDFWWIAKPQADMPTFSWKNGLGAFQVSDNGARLGLDETELGMLDLLTMYSAMSLV